LTNKDPRKLKYFGPKKIAIPPGTLVGDMAIANRFYRAETEEEKQKYAEEYRQSLKPYPVDIGQYRMPELLIPREGVAEAFDQPYKLKWEKSDYGDVDALATLQDGTSLSIMFNLADKLENNWGVEFYRNNSQAATGEGDAQRVFATVLAAIGQFIKKKKPNTLFFTAVKEEDPTGSRAKLYDRLVQRYATGLGYDLKKVDYPEQTGYKLTRQEQGVTEDFGQLDELVNKQLFRQGFEDTRSYGEYTLVAKPGYMPYIPGKNSVISNFFRIEAYKGRVMVGWVNFEDKDGDLEALDLQVDQKHRRKGIATAMYDFAKDLGNTIKPSTKQTAMGKKFWAGAKDRDR
jgi:GNAT superfamily N-acetyltransferase